MIGSSTAVPPAGSVRAYRPTGRVKPPVLNMAHGPSSNVLPKPTCWKPSAPKVARNSIVWAGWNMASVLARAPSTDREPPPLVTVPAASQGAAMNVVHVLGSGSVKFSPRDGLSRTTPSSEVASGPDSIAQVLVPGDPALKSARVSSDTGEAAAAHPGLTARAITAARPVVTNRVLRTENFLPEVVLLVP